MPICKVLSIFYKFQHNLLLLIILEGELSFNGENLQELLVKEGHAEIYKKYSKPCKWAS